MRSDDVTNMDDEADDDPSNLGFEWQYSQDYLQILRHGRSVTTLRGQAAERLAVKLVHAEFAHQQQLLARATGNYKRGNERLHK